MICCRSATVFCFFKLLSQEALTSEQTRSLSVDRFTVQVLYDSKNYAVRYFCCICSARKPKLYPFIHDSCLSRTSWSCGITLLFWHTITTRKGFPIPGTWSKINMFLHDLLLCLTATFFKLRDSVKMPAGVSWPRYLRMFGASILSMFLGAQVVHQYYLPDLVRDKTFSIFFVVCKYPSW